MDLKKILQNLELFYGLTDDEISELAKLCRQKTFHQGQAIVSQGYPGNEFYIITNGLVEVQLDRKEDPDVFTVVSLGVGQIFGEMSLVDKGLRSATVRAGAEPTIVQEIDRPSFENLCEQNTRIGYIVMRNIASDLSFKLRHSNLSDRVK